MQDSRFLSEAFEADDAVSWVKECALSSGWSADEASRLAQCVGDSAAAAAEAATSRRSSVWLDAELRTHQLCIART